MVSPAISTTLDPRRFHVLPVPLPSEDSLSHASAWSMVHPKCPVVGMMVEDSVGDGEVISSTHLEEEKAFAVSLANAMSSNDPIPGLVICFLLVLKSPRSISFPDCESAAVRVKSFIEFLAHGCSICADCSLLCSSRFQVMSEASSGDCWHHQEVLCISM